MACPNADRPCPGCPRLAATGDAARSFLRPEEAPPPRRAPEAPVHRAAA